MFARNLGRFRERSHELQGLTAGLQIRRRNSPQTRSRGSNEEVSSIDSFVAQLQAAGQLDSSGRFTLDLAKAREKLQAFQLADPSFYLLKIVQAAVCSGASKIEVRLRRSQVELAFDAPPTAFPPGELAAQFEQPLQGRTAVSHLAIGLLGALAHGPVTWSCLHPDRREQLRIEAESITFDQPEPEIDHTFRFTLERPGQPWLAGLRQRAAEHRALYHRCAFAPIPVVVDGRELDSSLEAPQPDAEAWCYRLCKQFWLVHRYRLEEPGGAGLVAPPRELSQVGPGDYCCQPTGGRRAPAFLYQFRDPAGQPLERPAQRPARGPTLLALPVSLQGPAQICCVLHGVCLDPVEIDIGCPGLVGVVADPRLSTDLSQFQVLRDQAFDQMLAELASQALTMLQEFRPVLGELKRVPQLPPPMWEIVMGGAMIVLSLPLIALLAAAWFTWPFWIWSYYQQCRQEEEERRAGKYEPNFDQLMRGRIVREVDQAIAVLRAKTSQA